MSIEIITPLDTALQRTEARAAELSALVESKQRQIEELRVELETLKQAISSDSTLLSDTLIAEANQRQWCDEYDEIVDTLNSRLRVIVIQQREQEFEIEVDIEGTIRTTTTVCVTARNRDEAREMIRYNLESHVDGHEVLQDAIYNLGFDDIEMEMQ